MTAGATPMHSWFLRGLDRAATRPAVRAGSKTLTYAEVHETAARWAWQLRELAPEGPTAVGLLTEQNETRYLGFLAVLYAGATVVPLNPRWPVSRIRQVLDAASAKVLIADQHHAETSRAWALLQPSPRVFGPVEQAAAMTGQRSYLAEGSPHEIAYIIFTSGSTGVPKGVPITHGNIAAFLSVVSSRYDIGITDVFSQLAEISFDLSMFEIFAAWSAGACVCAISKVQAAIPARCIADWGITVWTSTPSLATALCNGDHLPAHCLEGLRYSVFCGEPLPVRTARYWQTAAPLAVLDNLYGPTEAAVACTGFQLMPDADWDDLGDGETVPIGWPFPGVECLLEGKDGHREASGELCLAGAQVFPGYLDSDGSGDPFMTQYGRRWYRTGDQVRQTAGHGLVHLGRIDDQVKINGYRVEPTEVERAIERCLPGVSTGVIAIRREDRLMTLVAFVAGTRHDAAELRRKLYSHLPPYMIPAHIWTLPQVPLNHNGKVDRPALREIAVRLLPK